MSQPASTLYDRNPPSRWDVINLITSKAARAGLNPVERCLLNSLAVAAAPDGEVRFKTREQLMEENGWSDDRSTWYAYLNKLAKRGLIEVVGARGRKPGQIIVKVNDLESLLCPTVSDTNPDRESPVVSDGIGRNCARLDRTQEMSSPMVSGATSDCIGHNADLTGIKQKQTYAASSATPPRGRSKPVKPTRQPNPNFTPLRDHWFASYERRYRHVPGFEGAQAKVLDRLLKDTGDDLHFARRTLDAYLACTDRHIVTREHPLADLNNAETRKRFIAKAANTARQSTPASEPMQRVIAGAPNGE